MEWIYLIIAGVFEIVWAIGLKYANGFTKLWPSVITVVGMAISLVFLAFALKKIPIGTAYAVWTGIGIMGTVILGILLFKEPVDGLRIFFIALIVTGVIGLKMISPE